MLASFTKVGHFNISIYIYIYIDTHTFWVNIIWYYLLIILKLGLMAIFSQVTKYKTNRGNLVEIPLTK